MAKPSKPKASDPWYELIVLANALGTEEFGELPWATMASVAQEQMANKEIALTTQKDLAFLTFGLYLGAFFVKYSPALQGDQPCQPTEQA